MEIKDARTASPANDPDASTTDSGYTGMTIAELKATYDQAIRPPTSSTTPPPAAEAAGVTTKATVDVTHYCVYAQVGNWFAYKLNPAGVILQTTDPTKVCT
jgi:hypothetical protein